MENQVGKSSLAKSQNHSIRGRLDLKVSMDTVQPTPFSKKGWAEKVSLDFSSSVLNASREEDSLGNLL